MDTLQADAQFASSGENKVIRRNQPTAEADDEESLTQSHLFNEPSRILDIFKDENKLEDESTLNKGRGIDRRGKRRDG
ncbi:hypothetical protein YC2023_017352 [Brassica napus]